MYIEKYRYRDTSTSTSWNFSEIDFKRVNLLVGKSGCGKTRFLATIFNLGNMIAAARKEIFNGDWDVTYRHGEFRYRYELRFVSNKVEFERLKLLDTSSDVYLLNRTTKSLEYRGKKLPQLALEQPALALLKEEKSIESAFSGFGSICRRRFDQDGLGMVRAYGNVPSNLLKSFEETGINSMQIFDLPLSSRIYLIERLDKPLYSRIKEMFQGVFPEFVDWQVRKLKATEVPLQIDGIMTGVFLTERDVKGQIPLTELSSGMQKVLLIITDVLSAPKGTIYLIDEYENSLGVNAIDFLPDLLALSPDIQAVVTTHHPYLINAMPIDNWQIMSRKGSNVSIARGDTRKKIYEASSQEAFTQLLNDPFYSDA